MERPKVLGGTLKLNMIVFPFEAHTLCEKKQLVPFASVVLGLFACSPKRRQTLQKWMEEDLQVKKAAKKQDSCHVLPT